MNESISGNGVIETGEVQLASGKQTVEYEVFGDVALFEGDICLGSARQLRALRGEDPDFDVGALDDDELGIVYVDEDQQGVPLPLHGRRWNGGIVHYVIDGADGDKVRRAMQHWSDQTPIRFVERTTETDFIRFFLGRGCWSLVGRAGGQQDLSTSPHCSWGNIVHEIGHALGLWHEHSRSDRDQWITINWGRIDDTKRHNFNQHLRDGADVNAYDYGSIMHYGPTAFTTDPFRVEKTIVPTTDGVVIGQREALSAGDIAAILAVYPLATGS